MTREKFYTIIEQLKQEMTLAMQNGQFYPEVFDANKAVQIRDGIMKAAQAADMMYEPGMVANVYDETLKNIVRSINSANLIIDFSKVGIDMEMMFPETSKTK